LGKYLFIALNNLVLFSHTSKILKKIGLLISLFLCLTANAQVKHMFDSMRYDFKQRKKFFVSLDGKNNLVSDMNLKMFGLQGGYQYNKRTSVYLGIYWTYNNPSKIIANAPAVGQSDSNTIYSSYGITYINFGTEYIFFNTKKWRLSIPAALGIGRGYNIITQNNKVIKKERSGILPLELGLNVSYKLKWWLWIGAGIGTRFSLNSTNEYNGSFYTFGLQLKTGEIYKRVKKLVKKEK